jgi:hypothetical protein
MEAGIEWWMSCDVASAWHVFKSVPAITNPDLLPNRYKYTSALGLRDEVEKRIDVE